MTRTAGALARQAPVMLETEGWADYALIDSGNGEKLERYGPYTIVRPEAQALWTPRRPAAEWERADAKFVGIGDEEADGRWRYAKAARRDLADGLGRHPLPRPLHQFPPCRRVSRAGDPLAVDQGQDRAARGGR